ncbi:TPA: hypothetical protein ACH3X3_008910 [Trebouxia sp. C0006]
MHPAKALLAGQQPTAASPSKPNVVSFPGKKQPQGSPAGPRIPVGQPRKWLRIDEEGKSAYIKVEKHQLVGYLNIPYRDLRILDPLAPIPYPTAIFIREKALVVNVESIRMIICADQILVLSVPDPLHPNTGTLPALRHPFIKELVSRMEFYLSGNGDQALPFELQAFEVPLAAAVRLFESETTALEAKLLPSLERLTAKVSKRELLAVQTSKATLNRLLARVRRLTEVLEAILDDDQDMQDMYLARRAEMADMIAPDPDNPPDDLTDPALALLPSVSSSSFAETALTQALQNVASTQEQQPASPQNLVSNHAGQSWLNQRSDQDQRQDVEDESSPQDSRHPLEMAVPDQSDVSEDDRRLSNTAVDILGHLAQDQRPEHQQLFSRDSLGAEEVGLAAMEGWQWTPDTQQGVQWNLGGGQAGEAGPHPGSLEGVDSLPEAMAKSRKSASRRVSRSNSKQFERLTSQVASPDPLGRMATIREPDASAVPVMPLVAILDEEGQMTGITCPLNVGVDPHDIEGCEDLLESYFMQVDSVLSRLTALKERIEGTEALIEIDLDHRRNELVAFDLVLTMVTLSFTLVGALAGLMGMNLYFAVVTTPLVCKRIVYEQARHEQAA